LADFLEVQRKVLERICVLEGKGILEHEEADDLVYWLEAAGRLHEAGDVGGGWNLLKDVAHNVPTIKIARGD